MAPPVDHEVEASGQEQGEPLRSDAEGHPVFAEFDEVAEAKLSDEELEVRRQEIAALDRASDAELMAMAGVEPVVSTTEAAEYFDRTSQWIYWGLKPDEKTGEHIFTWPDGSPIVPERVGDPETGHRRFTMPILRAILQSCYRRGNIDPDELRTIMRRIRYTELGVEWRAREGWKYVYLGRNRHKWVRPEEAFFDKRTKTWRLRKHTSAPRKDEDE
ncbi:hypothetical protein PBI_ARCHERS7_195 [Mycobacterium phage ArcherS7]|uniref:DUF7229 domain-containing protein n=9 Tax=Bixzunavirus TaxID=680114 RepID=A0A2D1G7H0_9CAUD|nr:hypothetical protein ET08_183 [Mycobacterium phage ET08]YP_008061424.1 hypothetical protein M180_gp156 [Mycobacterium phage ArcherS7]YP_009016627.1 hypothetical protein NAPPY_196 [Mycobacterium phage Nappy]YP_009017497.1 hypothetical protein MOMOMIXON_193 [Mycobacterium phage MoMoMixon]YP_009597756.1 hypothetical protein FDH18_gp142 [Mycobacterium phage Lukilu]YP_010057116.1 hypothetical protein KHO58_gp158 [Mycobacterium phage Bigswole]YP_010057569.1 hypothetical protein KHO60_gp151 [Myco